MDCPYIKQYFLHLFPNIQCSYLSSLIFHSEYRWLIVLNSLGIWQGDKIHCERSWSHFWCVCVKLWQGWVATPPSNFSDTSCMPYNSTQFWRYVHRNSIRSHRLRGSVPQDCHLLPTTSDTNGKSRLLCFWPTSYRLEVPTTLSLGLINFLEQLTELRETFHLLDYQFIIKGYSSGTTRGRQCTRQGMGKRLIPRSLSEYTLLPKSPCVHQPRSSLNCILFGFYTGFIT